MNTKMAMLNLLLVACVVLMYDSTDVNAIASPKPSPPHKIRLSGRRGLGRRRKNGTSKVATYNLRIYSVRRCELDSQINYKVSH